MSELPRVDADRLWDAHMQMARIGATAAGGCRRLALGAEDVAARALFARWAGEAGCAVSFDSMGNVFARRPGRDATRPPVAAGSHLDTQPHGGRFDGVYGVLAALEVLRTLDERRIDTVTPLEAVVWSNEEGARFAPTTFASAVFAGAREQAEALAVRDADGTSYGEALLRSGQYGEERCGQHPLSAYFEAHIEQGPVLEKHGDTIGVVGAAQGLRWYDVAFSGQDAHAGTTPMDARRDALVGAADGVLSVRQLALAHAPLAVATVGELRVSPNSRNTIPGRVEFSIDLRHPEQDMLDVIEQTLAAALTRVADRHGLQVAFDRVTATPPVRFDATCVQAVREAASALGLRHREMVSGATHDACHLARVAPSAMIFVPCAGGLSHNEQESADAADLAAGCNVLLRAMLARAGLAP